MKAALSPAYVWDCDNCGRENWQRSITNVLDPDDPDDAEMIRGMTGREDGEEIDPDEVYSIQTSPTNVTCKWCGSEYETVALGQRDVYGDDQDDDDDEEGHDEEESE
jgi:hypothetical protein